MKQKTVSITILLLSLALTVSCSRGNGEIMASGIFEADVIVVSAEGSGRILAFTAREGVQVREGEVLGEIDSRQLLLRKNQLLAGAAALASRIADPEVQTAPLEQQIRSALTEQVRIENLLKANAANQKALDDVNARIALLRSQLAAQKSSILSANSSLEHERQALRFQIDQLDDQIEKCRITAPRSGTVLVSYAGEGETAAPGRALFKLANLDEMIFRAYISSDQLSTLRLGQKVRVLADFASRGEIPYDGTVSWIADEAEFTPKTIQTRDERENLVYAVKVRVPNDGYLKIGMYGSLTVGE
jgi:HlyD family secretion protein